MKLSRIISVLGAVALGAVLVASNPGASASPGPTPHRAPHVATYHFPPPKPHKLRPHSNLPMGLHCDSTDMSY
jgi:hypothetical protein